MTLIEDINDPRIAAYRSLRSNTMQANDGSTFIAEGERIARAFFASSLQAHSMLALPQFYTRFGSEIQQKNIPPELCYVASRSMMEEIVGFKMHSGILINGKQPPRVALHKLTPPIVAVCTFADSENLGALIRNCAAFGVRSLLLDEKSNNPWLRRSVRVSMGTIFSMNIHQCSSLADALHELRHEEDYRLYAAEITEHSRRINSVQWAEKSLIVFGNEAYGVDEHILSLCHEVVHIPIVPQVNSINVAASSAVILHHYYEQRSERGGK